MITTFDDPNYRPVCRRGHSLRDDDPNTYLWRNKDGRQVRHCRKCQKLRLQGDAGISNKPKNKGNK